MRAFLVPIFSFVFCLGVVFLFLLSTGEAPQALLQALHHTFFTSFGLGYTLFYATTLLLCGLSVGFAFKAGLFNIGAEGQLLWGSLAVVAASHYFPELPPFLAIPFGITASFMAGGIWGWIPGFLKAKRGTHEVIVTILLNFIALAITNYLILYVFKNPLSQAAETELIGSSFWLPGQLFRTTPLNGSLFFALALCIFLECFFSSSSWGYELRTLGGNPRAARFSGIQQGKMTCSAFAGAGALAGLVGINEVMGSEHQVIEGFSPGYGFMGIAVALTARNRPLNMIFSSFFFGSLYTFSREIEFFTEHLSKEVSIVLQALLLIFYGTRQAWEPSLKRILRT